MNMAAAERHIYLRLQYLFGVYIRMRYPVVLCICDKHRFAHTATHKETANVETANFEKKNEEKNKVEHD